MLIPNDISIEFDSSLPVVFDGVDNMTFDGVVVFRFEPGAEKFRASYANKFATEIIGSGALSRISQKDLENSFGLSLDGAGLGNIFSELLGSTYSGNRTGNFNLRSVTGRAIAAHCVFSLIPLDLDGVDSASVAVICLIQDLGRSGAERLLGDASSVATSMTVGNDLGKLCYQVCRQLETTVGDGVKASISVAGPTGQLAPVILGGYSAPLIELLAEYGSRYCRTSETTVLKVSDLPRDLAGPLQMNDVSELMLVPILGDRKPTGEEVGHGILFDFGHVPTLEFDLNGLIVLTSDRSFDLSLESEEFVYSAQQVASEAVISAYKLSTESIESSHDLLTSLPNREKALESLQEVLNGCEPEHSNVCVMLLDIDKFKSINHNFGSDMGDKVLRTIAERLLASVRLGDQVARISSDQYLVVCVTQHGELDPNSVARRVLETVNQPVQINEGGELTITASLGMVAVDDPTIEPVDVLSQAESALQTASSRGRGEFVLFVEGQIAEADAEAELEQAMFAGLEADQFKVFYQPLVETQTKRMVGAEALIRWEHPDKGLISPIDFIPLAEENGFIIDLGMWVIDRVCADLAEWPLTPTGRPVITINLAAKQLGSDTLVPGIISALRRHNLHPSNIGFEITESMEISNLDAALKTLAKLKELNCRIAIDDFGIGHATMEYLRSFSMADALKIDRSFVAGLGQSIEDSAIVKASLALAEALGMQVVAEGVETKAQLEALAELKCRYSQGYGFSKPVEVSTAHEFWIKSHLEGPLE